MDINISDKYDENDVNFLRKKILEFNEINMDMKAIIEPVCFSIKNEDTIIAGISGIIYMNEAHVDLLWVDDALRGSGYGKLLLQKFEDFASKENCRHILLDTFSFQAPDFYISCGYELLHTLDYSPIKKSKRYYLKKQLHISNANL